MISARHLPSLPLTAPHAPIFWKHPPPCSSCTAASGSDVSQIGESWGMLKENGSHGASGASTGTALGGTVDGSRGSASPRPPLSTAWPWHKQAVAAAPDSPQSRASGLHKAQLAPKQQEHICPSKKSRKKRREEEKVPSPCLSFKQKPACSRAIVHDQYLRHRPRGRAWS